MVIALPKLQRGRFIQNEKMRAYLLLTLLLAACSPLCGTNDQQQENWTMGASRDIDTVYVYRDSDGDWRWTRQSQNGRTVGASTEGYRRKIDCIANADRQTRRFIMNIKDDSK